MRINRDNYEIYFIDFLDGNLDLSLETELTNFLLQNPDLAEELNLLRGQNFKPEKVDFNAKEILHKNSMDIVPANFESVDHFLAAYFEGDLTSEEQKQFDRLMKINPSIVDELEFFQKARLEPDLNVSFEEKELLKDKIKIPEHFSGIDEFLVAKLEDDLDLVDLVTFNNLVGSNENLKNEFELFRKTKIQADASEIFDRKDLLKRQLQIGFLTRIKPMLVPLAAAAMLIVCFMFVIQTGNNRFSNLKYALNNNSNETTGKNATTFPMAGIRFYPGFINKQNHNFLQNIKNPQSPVQIIANSGLQEISTLNYQNEIPVAEFAYLETYRLSDAFVYDETSESNTANNEEPATLLSFAEQNLKKRILDENEPQDRKLTMWDMAGAGIKEINKISGSDMEMKKDFDRQGNLVGVNFNSNLIAFSAPVKKK